MMCPPTKKRAVCDTARFSLLCNRCDGGFGPFGEFLGKVRVGLKGTEQQFKPHQGKPQDNHDGENGESESKEERAQQVHDASSSQHFFFRNIFPLFAKNMPGEC